jgi:predicted transcriptional regulator
MGAFENQCEEMGRPALVEAFREALDSLAAATKRAHHAEAELTRKLETLASCEAQCAHFLAEKEAFAEAHARVLVKLSNATARIVRMKEGLDCCKEGRCEKH